MITHIAETRGFANHGWLKSHHTFSFADYYDPKRMGFGALRVINDDVIAGGMGFGTHPHRDMEIITVLLDGVLAHKDSMGNGYEIKKGEIQVMSAGTGIAHSEFNALPDKAAKLLQIWVLPKKIGIQPRYDQKAFTYKKNDLNLIVSPDGQESTLWINQDAFFSVGEFEAGNDFTYKLKKEGNGLYVFIINGELEIDGKAFKSRDGIGLTAASEYAFRSLSDTEVLLMEVPMLGMNA